MPNAFRIAARLLVAGVIALPLTAGRQAAAADDLISGGANAVAGGAVAGAAAAVAEAAAIAGSTVEIIRISDGHIGAGIQIRPGMILTAAHVVRDDASVTIRDDKGREIIGTVGSKDPVIDVALVNLPPDVTLAVSQLYCGMPRIGTPVTMIGHPYGRAFVTMPGAILSGVRRVSQWPSLILVDHEAMPGMSGGPVVGRDGKVLAMVVAATGRRGRTNGPAGAVPGAVICQFLPTEELAGKPVEYP